MPRGYLPSLLLFGFLAIQKYIQTHFLKQIWVSFLLLIIKNSFIIIEIALASYYIRIKALPLLAIAFKKSSILSMLLRYFMMSPPTWQASTHSL